MGINDFIKVGSKIKKARLKKGVRQKDMAAHLEIPVSTYANYEANRREPDIETIGYIASYLDVPFDFFMQNQYDDPDDYIEFQKKRDQVLRSKDPRDWEDFFCMEPGSIPWIGSEEEMLEQKVLEHFKKLNFDGKIEAEKRLEELTLIDKYIT